MATSTESRDSAGAELLKIMSPSQILPNHVIAVRRWRRINEKTINEKIKRNFMIRRNQVVACRDVEFKRNKKIPLDALAKDWLESIGGTDELRVYLIEHCLPSLVLGLESLLIQVQEHPGNTRFNPIDYLAQYLMRNNPRYNHSTDGSPYMKGLNQVKEELRQLVSTLRQNKASKITSEARRHRYERQRIEALLPQEMERRAVIVSQTYDCWSFGDESIPMYKIQRAMRSFMEERVPSFNPEMREVCKYILRLTVEDRKEAITKTMYTKFVCDHIEGWPIGTFHALLRHIDSCAKAVPIGDQRQKIQSSLTSLFRAIDKDKVKSLDRAHILTLIKAFYNTVPVNMKKYITNPLDWSDKDTIYSPTPAPSTVNALYESTTRSVSINVPGDTPQTPPTVQISQKTLTPEKTEEESPASDAETDDELKHDIEIIAKEYPSPLTQSRLPEIDTRLSIEQFLYMTEKLLGEDPHPRALTALSEFLEDSFQETPQQRQSRQLHEKLAAKKHTMMIKINDLFDEWDNEKLGFLDKTEILSVLAQWQKTSTKSYNVEMSKQICKAVEELDTQSILRDDFLKLCNTFHSILDSDDYMDRLLDFVTLVVQTQRSELKRERKRRRWLDVMKLLPKISGSDHSLYFRSFFDIIEKDFAYHGSGRLINAYVALVETDPDADDDDEEKTLLKYVASTANDNNILTGRMLYANQKCISNQVKRSGKAVYINQIRNNNQVHLWAMDRWAVDEERDGAFLVLPMKPAEDTIVGVVGVDTLLSNLPTQFMPHEIAFIQNLVKKLSEGFSYLDARHKFQRTLISLLEVVPRKEASVRAAVCYVVEPVPHVVSGPQDPSRDEELVLRPILSLSDKSGIVDTLQGSARAIIRRSDSSFRYSEAPSLEHDHLDGKRDYLFDCLEKREDQQMRAYGTDHTAMCIIGPEDKPFAVLDFDTGKAKANILNPAQITSIRTLFGKLMDIFKELLEETINEKKEYNDELEKTLPDELRFALRFERTILEDLKRRMSNMDVGALSEIKSYIEPPPIIATVIQAVLLILGICPEDELQEWTKIKTHLNSELLKKLSAFDPLDKEHKVDIHKVNDRLKDLTAHDVKRGGSIPTYLLYQWVVDVISIIRVGDAHLR